MTSAPAGLRGDRELLLDHLGPHGLHPLAVGIVGDAAHRGGYHTGKDRVREQDYSVVESSRDRTGLTLDASALDIGTFSYRGHNLRTFSVWLVRECEAGAPDTRDIREVIYSPDGRTVKRWDRLRKRTSGDDSHLTHTHISVFRDATRNGRSLRAVLTRYLRTIGLIEGNIFMSLTDAEQGEILRAARLVNGALNTMNYRIEALTSMRETYENKLGDPARPTSTNALAVALNALTGRDMTDEPEIIAGVLRGLTPDMIAQAFILAGWTPEQFAAAIPDSLAREVVNELSGRLAGQ